MYLEKLNILDISQHGFTAKNSTITALAEATRYFHEAFNKRENFIRLFFGLRHAFEMVVHGLLNQNSIKYVVAVLA